MQSGITLCASLLAGGYERFSSEYPEFCAKTKSLSNVSPPTSAEPLDLGCSSCGTPFHDQVCLEAHCLAILTALLALQPAPMGVSLLSLSWGLWSQSPASFPLMVVLLIPGCSCVPKSGQAQILLTHTCLFLNRTKRGRGRAQIDLAPPEGSLCSLF